MTSWPAHPFHRLYTKVFPKRARRQMLEQAMERRQVLLEAYENARFRQDTRSMFVALGALQIATTEVMKLECGR